MVHGGIAYDEGCVSLTIRPSGGNAYTRVFDDVVDNAVERFVLFETLLGPALSNPISSSDMAFYVNQLRYLLSGAHVQQLPGEMPFQQKFNMWLLDGYVRMLLANGTVNLALVAQLLGLDLVLHYVEDAEDVHARIPFRVPQHVSVKIPADSVIAKPAGDETQAYVRSLSGNLSLLISLLKQNKTALEEIHQVIFVAASKRFK